ncbi:uncharacterized protein SAPINGB_P003273 [Magnusiomyces paraingens]|uniref:Glucose-6-phosphate 1-epimerase n=1 Tax=Magnusiomyces paraingens TaxID=2606893 RepID=A0A5E8BN76_9ASCO|nr:uncharacterized protein SAPINGB_P003273 [Saprochaete ingens]VVT51969.1 unnamed protein product [Saprochaete ingens]
MASIEQTDTEVILKTADGIVSARVLLKGATVLSWKVHGQEQLWLSESAILDGDKGVRGGIPLVFPHFGPVTKSYVTSGETLPQHGFARNSQFEFLGQISDSPLSVQFGLGPENVPEKLQRLWPYNFTLIFTVTLDKSILQTSISIENPKIGVPDAELKKWDFNWLFHTYFHVPNGIDSISVTGLNNLDYYNKVLDSNAHEDSEEIIVTGELDRVYKNTNPSCPVFINDSGSPIFEIIRENLDDIVVWNPWENNMGDFSPKTGFNDMICVEAGTVSHSVTLNPGEKWEASQTIKSNL